MRKKNIFSIDTEDWFQVGYGSETITRSHWSSMTHKIDAMVESTLELLESRNVLATFFVVGWLAEKHPNLIRKIAENGHEVASHGYWHSEVFRQSPAEFSEDIKRAKACLEDAAGEEVYGYRAPGYSIGRREEWALDLLLNVGYRYDSSLLHASRLFGQLENGLYEVAPNALNILGRYFPCNGGFIFRILPYFLYKQYVRYLRLCEKPLVFYVHTWEIFHDYPRMEMPFVKNFIQYANLEGVIDKLDHLLCDFEFTSIAEAYPMMKDAGALQTPLEHLGAS